jgi:hypothetical protein
LETTLSEKNGPSGSESDPTRMPYALGAAEGAGAGASGGELADGGATPLKGVRTDHPPEEERAFDEEALAPHAAASKARRGRSRARFMGARLEKQGAGRDSRHGASGIVHAA